MTITQMLGQSATLTLLGMGVVFSFLIILIIAMMLVEKLVKLLKLDQEEKQSGFAAASAVQGTVNQSAVVAAIAAAVRQKQNN